MKENGNMIQRTEYISQLEPFIGKDIIKVITGMRRSGKSTLLETIRSKLLDDGIAPSNNIIIINFESMQWEDAASSAQAFYQTVLELTQNIQSKIYLFFDEVQAVPNWERAINSLRVDLDCDIYITGSNSKLLAGELSTLLAGRYVTVEVFPFSLKEIAEAIPNKSPRELYDLYRIYGGLPFLSHIDYAPESSISYLRDVFNSIVLKDIVQRRKLRNSDQLERVLSYFMSEVGTTLSVNNIANSMKNDGRKISVESIYNYLQAAEEAMLLTRARRYDIKGKAILQGSEKAYLTDVGLREAMFGNNARRLDLVLENIVFVELRRRGFQAYVGRIDKKEIDFVAERGGNRIYIQVAYLLESESTREREFSALQAVDDNYPKLIVSVDETDWSDNGIKCWNTVDFLLSSDWER